MSEELNPFTLEEHSLLGQALETDDLEYLKQWSKDAFTWYESEKGRLIRLFEKEHSTATILEEELRKVNKKLEAVREFVESLKVFTIYDEWGGKVIQREAGRRCDRRPRDCVQELEKILEVEG